MDLRFPLNSAWLPSRTREGITQPFIYVTFALCCEVNLILGHVCIQSFSSREVMSLKALKLTCSPLVLFGMVMKANKYQFYYV